MVLHRTTARRIALGQRASRNTRGNRPQAEPVGRVGLWPVRPDRPGAIGALSLTACAAMIAGCAGGQGSNRPGASAPSGEQDPIQAFLEGGSSIATGAGGSAAGADAPAQRAQDEARRQAERLVAAMQAEAPNRPASPESQGDASGGRSPASGAESNVNRGGRGSTFTQPQDPWAVGGRSDRAPLRQVVRQAPGRIEPLPAPLAPAPAAESAAPASSPTPTSAPDRRELVEQLLRDIRRGAGPDLLRAAQISAVGVISDEQELRLSDLSNLTPRQTDLVKAFDRVLTETARQFASGRRDLALSEVFDQWRELEGDRPIQIRDMKLCRRVSGYGVYDAFDDQRFLAGQEQAVIVYVELDHFTPRQVDQGEFEVKLNQGVVLYNAQDGLEVWRQPEEEIVDRSRNRRRDFFVVQLIRLPARLSVGKYVLKARVTDQYGGSVAEQSTRLDIVADTSMVTRSR